MIGLSLFLHLTVAAFGAAPRDTIPMAPTVTGPRDTLIPTPHSEPLIWLVSDHRVERQRLAELFGRRAPAPLLLRSMSSLLRATEDRESRKVFLPLMPEIQLVSNSALPFSMNDGPLWAGRGASFRIGAGFAARTGPLRIVLAPELVVAGNQFFHMRHPGFFAPEIPPDRSPYVFPWYAVGPYSIDMPTRFGEVSVSRLDPGQSSIALSLRHFEFGLATENHWWGPGVRNALILSNNAPGFPHLFLRPARPFRMLLGQMDLRWIVGGLSESEFFDTVSTNDLRSISALALTLRPRWVPNLTLGGARSVWGTSTGWSEIPLRWLEVFHLTRRQGGATLSDSALYPGGREQLNSLFARWVFPRAGFETYVEWGRTHLPSSVRDFVVAPNHTQAYTIGLQWTRRGFQADDAWRLHAENTSVEQSATFRDRPVGVWYTSRHVIQGYTHRGQLLGAAVGPGSSGQSLAVDYIRPAWLVGLKAGRMRLNEDVRSIFGWPAFQAWCTHDINLYWGARVESRLPLGYAAADLTFGNRIQPWFQVQSGCPRGDAMLDIRNTTLSITVAPFSWR